jgi:hypothetical protein
MAVTAALLLFQLVSPATKPQQHSQLIQLGLAAVLAPPPTSFANSNQIISTALAATKPNS